MNKANFSILIDYAHEPESLSQFLQTLADWRKNGYFDLIIHILSCDGVGRDDWKKPIMGSLSYKYADFTVLTTDNYGEKDNPQEIVELLGKDFIDKDELLSKEWLDYHLNLEFDEEKEFKKTKKVKFLLEIDRKIAMKKSLKVAQFLASNYDYLILKKFNLQLTKGKINDKNNKSFLKGINSTSKWDKISNIISENIDENKQNSTKNLEKNWQDETENQQIDSENDKNDKIMESNKENLELELTNLDQKTFESKQKEQILAEDYLENELKILQNKQNILSQIKNLTKEIKIKSGMSKMEMSETLSEKININSNLEIEQDLEQNLESLEQKQREIKVLIVSTGVGCEPFLSQPSGNLKWNEKEIWQEIWQEFEKTLQK